MNRCSSEEAGTESLKQNRDQPKALTFALLTAKDTILNYRWSTGAPGERGTPVVGRLSQWRCGRAASVAEWCVPCSQSTRWHNSPELPFLQLMSCTWVPSSLFVYKLIYTVIKYRKRITLPFFVTRSQLYNNYHAYTHCLYTIHVCLL